MLMISMIMDEELLFQPPLLLLPITLQGRGIKAKKH